MKTYVVNIKFFQEVVLLYFKKLLLAMNKSTFLLLLLLSVILPSCATSQHVTVKQNPNQYVGLSHQQVVAQLGAPTNEFSDGADGYILTFEGNKNVFDYGRKYVKNSDTMPTLQLFFDSEGYCTKAITTNTQPVKAVSAGLTVLLILGILIIL